ncbi:MAG TPA: Ldh family oxidoreductase [Candidatus Dormibacteraeota bacterium]
MAEVLVPAPALESWTKAVVRAMGAGEEVAAEVAHHLVGANLAGHDSHGVLRLPQYMREVDSGTLVPDARPDVVRSRGAVGVIDAHRGFGHYSTRWAVDWCIDLARREGVATAAVRHAMHIGRLGEYGERAASEGLVGFFTVGVAGQAAGSVAPFWGAERFLGTNPWCMAVPAVDRPPLVIDFATSAIAEGKVRVARAKGVEVPPGTLRAPSGEPTREPSLLYEGGMLLPAGGEVAGHKGYGLSLASALIGGLAMIDDPEPTPGGTMMPFPDEWSAHIAGVWMMVVDPGWFGPADQYLRRVSAVLDSVAGVKPAPGFEGVLVPGDPERLRRAERQASGVPIPEATWTELTELSRRLGVAMPAR